MSLTGTERDLAYRHNLEIIAMQLRCKECQVRPPTKSELDDYTEASKDPYSVGAMQRMLEQQMIGYELEIWTWTGSSEDILVHRGYDSFVVYGVPQINIHAWALDELRNELQNQG